MGNELNNVVKYEIDNAPKTRDGSIARKGAIKILQNIFKKNDGSVTKSKSNAERRGYDGSLQSATSRYPSSAPGLTGFGYGYGYGYGGYLSQTKDLFELYMDKDSEAGEYLTVNEQKAIIETVQNWMRSIGK